MSGAPSCPDRSQELLTLGRWLQADSVEAATGRCFTTVLELAALAQDRRIPVDLVKWQVQGDPSFADHWAVRLDADRAIDPTRMQVDGSCRLVCGLDQYPDNYRRRRIYPATILLPSYRRLALALARSGAESRLREGFVAACNARLFAFDVLGGVATLDPSRVLGAFVEAGRFALSAGTGAARRRLEARAALLELRMRDGDPAGRRPRAERDPR